MSQILYVPETADPPWWPAEEALLFGPIPVPAEEPPPPGIPATIAQYRRGEAAPGRRGELFATPVTVAVAPEAPGWVARIARAHLPQRLAPHRGEFLPVPPLWVAGPAPLVTSRRHPTAMPRRGEFLSLPPSALVLGGPGPWLPPHVTRRRTPAQARRGEWFQIPLIGAAPAPPTPAPPQIIEGRRSAVAPRRHGAFGRVVAVVAQPPPKATSQRRHPRLGQRRGQFLTLWPQAAPPGEPPPSVPGLMARRRPGQPMRRRGAYAYAVVGESVVGGPGTLSATSRASALSASSTSARAASTSSTSSLTSSTAAARMASTSTGGDV